MKIIGIFVLYFLIIQVSDILLKIAKLNGYVIQIDNLIEKIKKYIYIYTLKKINRNLI